MSRIGVVALVAVGTFWPLVVAVVTAPRLADVVEAACVKGRLSAGQAEAVDRLVWDRRPGYCAGEDYVDDHGVARSGNADCVPRAGDRVVAASCAQALRALGSGD